MNKRCFSASVIGRCTVFLAIAASSAAALAQSQNREKALDFFGQIRLEQQFLQAVRSDPKSPEAISRRLCARYVRSDLCLEYLEPFIAEAKVQAEALRAEEQRQREEQAALAKAKEQAEAEARNLRQKKINERYAASGDAEKLKLSCYEDRDVSRCVDEAFMARVAALKAKTVQPVGCREFGLANGFFLNGSEPMAVSLSPSKLPGLFTGVVTNIEGRSLAIFNSDTGLNAIVRIEGSKLFEADQIAVQRVIVGYGTHAGTTQRRLLNGAVKSVAVISALCVSPN